MVDTHFSVDLVLVQTTLVVSHRGRTTCTGSWRRWRCSSTTCGSCSVASPPSGAAPVSSRCTWRPSPTSSPWTTGSGISSSTCPSPTTPSSKMTPQHPNELDKPAQSTWCTRVGSAALDLRVVFDSALGKETILQGFGSKFWHDKGDNFNKSSDALWYGQERHWRLMRRIQGLISVVRVKNASHNSLRKTLLRTFDNFVTNVQKLLWQTFLVRTLTSIPELAFQDIWRSGGLPDREQGEKLRPVARKGHAKVSISRVAFWNFACSSSSELFDGELSLGGPNDSQLGEIRTRFSHCTYTMVSVKSHDGFSRALVEKSCVVEQEPFCNVRTHHFCHDVNIPESFCDCRAVEWIVRGGVKDFWEHELLSTAREHFAHGRGHAQSQNSLIRPDSRTTPNSFINQLWPLFTQKVRMMKDGRWVGHLDLFTGKAQLSTHSTVLLFVGFEHFLRGRMLLCVVQLGAAPEGWQNRWKFQRKKTIFMKEMRQSSKTKGQFVSPRLSQSWEARGSPSGWARVLQ